VHLFYRCAPDRRRNHVEGAILFPALLHLTIFCFLSRTIIVKLHQKSGEFHEGKEKMKLFLLAGALLLAVATLGPITRFVRFWAWCAKRRHQEAMIYLAYERGLITKAEIRG